MDFKTDIDIAREVKVPPINVIAKKAGILENELVPYGTNKAKVSLSVMDRLKDKQNGKLILVTALNPTPAGEGKTTVSIGLTDALANLGKNVSVALREPSLGPVFGVKGGATGGGYSQAVPMEDINLHFTGDLHAITSANNLLCALIDNHIKQGNDLDIDLNNITFKRCMDMNDRQLRNIECGLGGEVHGVPRKDGFDITAASEVMAVLCLSNDLEDLKRHLNDIVIGYSKAGKAITVEQIGAGGSMAVLLKDACMPNLVQTLGQTPAFIHGGPFANIAHGCNSIIATKMALKLSDIVVTEAGFGADLGAEKFLDIKCQKSGLWPNAVVVVATLKAMKCHGGVLKENAQEPNQSALKAGIQNVFKHVDNLKNVYGLPVVVAINKFYTDTDEEIALVKELFAQNNIKAVPADIWAKGGNGGLELAQTVIDEMKDTTPKHPYDINDPIKTKIQSVVTKIYGGGKVVFEGDVEEKLAKLTADGYTNIPVCIAKTQYSLSDDATKICRPTDFEFHVRDAKLSRGAGFIVILAGKIMTMPGLPKVPAAVSINIDNDGTVHGLF